MEYLTLQDIPHRHFYHPRSMAFPEVPRGSEKHLQGEMSAVVRPDREVMAISHLLHPQPSPAPPSSNSLRLSSIFEPAPPPHVSYERTRPYPPHFGRNGEKPFAVTPPQLPTQTSSLGKRALKSNFHKQTHHMRNSPPFQPGEQRPSQVLPSFQELMQNVRREPSPPRTPSRNQQSTETSPVTRGPQWEDVSWGCPDGKRRRVDRVDTVADIYHHHRSSESGEHPNYDRNRSSMLDPRLSTTYDSSRNSSTQHSGSHHHRPSLPYAPSSISSMDSHARHQSASSVHAPVAYPPHTMVPPAPYPSAHPHPGSYEHRGSYYPEPHPAAHGHPYERPHDPYYGPPSYGTAPAPGYDGSYHPPPQPYNYTFQSTLGVDQHSFGRKRRGNLPKEATAILKDWFARHRESPYPTEDEKVALCNQTQLSMNQGHLMLSWFMTRAMGFHLVEYDH